MIAPKRTPLILLLLAVTVATGLAAAPQRAVTSGPHDAPLTATVPVDPRITVGTLSNGMRYYIRANKQPQNRAELRLVVNAGSVLEDDDQRGLAHFVEHMAFNGTRHFPKQDVIAFLQSTGMRFGAHINANTSFDQTVYELQIPTDSPAVIDRSLLILEDWAHAVSFDAGRDRQGARRHPRGVAHRPRRAARGCSTCSCRSCSRTPATRDRLPIGKPEIIRTFPYDRLKKFYTDWYRPDLMAVIVVGDFDPAGDRDA